MKELKDIPFPEPGTLITVIGMPGSGKSTYIDAMYRQNPDLMVYDDYQASTFGDTDDPHLSKSYGLLSADLKKGKTAVVSDVRFCVPNELGRFLSAVLTVAPNTVLRFIYFANDPEQCKKNVSSRNREDRVEREIELIESLTKHYKPGITESVPVYQAV